MEFPEFQTGIFIESSAHKLRDFSLVPGRSRRGQSWTLDSTVSFDVTERDSSGGQRVKRERLAGRKELAPYAMTQPRPQG